DVLVAGGGPAGMAAALAAAEMGASVMLVEEEHQLGGHLRWSDGSLARQLRSQVKSTANIRVFTDATVAARYDDNWITVVQRRPSLSLNYRNVITRTRRFVVAPGLCARPYWFKCDDFPGITLSTAALWLINLYTLRPGDRAVVLPANPDGDAAVDDLRRAV